MMKYVCIQYRCLQSSGRTGSESKKPVSGALKPNEIRDFESVQRYGKKFYASVHEQDSQEEKWICEIF